VLHLVVIVVIIRCHSSSCDITVGLRRHHALSRVNACHSASSSCIVSAHLVTKCDVDRSTSHFVVRYCTSSSLYLATVHCHHQVTKQTTVFGANAKMNSRSGIRLLSRPMQSVHCEEMHSSKLQTTAAYKASAEQLITE